MKAELRSSKKSKKPSETKRSRNDGVIQLLDGTIAVIDTAKGVVPILLARGILETIANILTVVKTVIKNKSDFQAIANKCKTIGERLKSATKDATADDLPEYLGRALFRLKELVNNINSDIASKKEKGFFSRVSTVTIDRDRIAKWEKDLDSSLLFFIVEVSAGMAAEMKSVKELKSIAGNVPSIKAPKYIIISGELCMTSKCNYE